MGTQLGDIVKGEVVTLSDLKGRIIAIDAHNTLYQFLSTIRQPDGTPLMDHQGRITSHLSGLFYRNLNLLEQGIRPIYVFDGEAPLLKQAEIERRRALRESAYQEWERAKAEGRIEDALKAARASSRLTKSIIDESKVLLQALGIPVVQAPSEGEALAAQMTQAGIAWASASQDNDSLLYNCPRLVRNLSITGRRKVSRTKRYKVVHPEIIELDAVLRELQITREQLIDIAILVGTDYNEKIPGIGPKTALKLVKQYGRIEMIVKERGIEIPFDYNEIRQIFLNPPKADLVEPAWDDPNVDVIFKILCEEHDFSEQRVSSALERLRTTLAQLREESEQKTLTDFF